MVEAAHEPKERLLDEILGERPVARQEVGEPEPGRGRPLVDLGKPARAPLGSHVGEHRRPFRTHITRTNEDSEVLRRLVGRRVVYLTKSDSLVTGPELDGGVCVVAKVISIEALEETGR